MRQRRLRTLQLAALSSAAALGLGLLAAPSADAGGRHGGPPGPPTVVATGLDNPRQLAFTRDGALLVAESGEGGSGPCLAGPEGDEVCYGATGAVTRISARGTQSRILTGLPSLAATDGGSASGPADVAQRGRSVQVLIGLGADPAKRATLPQLRRMGTLVETTRGYSSLRTVADIAAFEGRANPVDDADSNPTGMLYEDGRYVVADAGGNTLVRVGRSGRVRLLTTFPTTQVDAPPFLELPPGTQIPMQAVPTSVTTRGRDGAYYVSQLTGFPFPAGGASIFRVDPRTGARTVYASGLTNVTDLAWSGDRLYAVQVATNGLLAGPTGSVVAVRRGGEVPADHRVVAGDLFAPYGIVIRGRSAYVTTGSLAKDVGQVIRIRL